MFRAFRYRLHPSPAQAERLTQWVGVVRMVYNLGLEQRRDWYRQFKANTGKSISYVSQSRELTALRAEFDWIADVPRVSVEQALRDLDATFQRFFKGAGFPTPRSRGINDTLRFSGRDVAIRSLNAKWGVVRLPKIGDVKFRKTRDTRGECRNITVTYRAGTWFVSALHDVGEPLLQDNAGTVGIDRGISQTISLSTGEHMSVPCQAALNRRMAKAARKLSRRRRGSRRYVRQRERLNALKARAARIRADALHRASKSIADRFGFVAMEALEVSNMTATGRGTIDAPGRGVRQKAGLNRTILEQGWGMFANMLAYKLEATGGRLLTCNPAYTSQTCSACGVIDKRSRESQAVFKCVACGHHDHADTNAAKNILLRSTEWLHVEGQTIAPAKREPAMAA